MRTLISAATLAAVAVLAISAAAWAGSQRPINGRITLAAAPDVPRCGPNALTLGLAGGGTMSHLGRVTGDASNCTEFTLGTSAVAIWDGMATFVAADGSSIDTTYEGGQDAPVAGVARASTTHTAVSGTGRFDTVAGTWTIDGTIDFSTGTFTGTISGWVSY